MNIQEKMNKLVIYYKKRFKQCKVVLRTHSVLVIKVGNAELDCTVQYYAVGNELFFRYKYPYDVVDYTKLIKKILSEEEVKDYDGKYSDIFNR